MQYQTFSGILLLLIAIVKPERIVVDPAHDGVPINYSYNETWTLSSLSPFVSVPGCPKSDAGYPWVLFGKDAPKCYPVGTQGPCPEKTLLHFNRKSQFGKCDFDRLTWCGSASILKHSDRYSFCRNTNCFVFVYDSWENLVHKLYHRGPCAKNEWLQHDGKGGVTCAPRLCPDHRQGLTFEADRKLQMNGVISQQDVSCCFFTLVLSGFRSLEGNRCPSNHFYSQRLQKCVRRLEDSGLVLG